MRELCPEMNFIFQNDSNPFSATERAIELLRSKEIIFIKPDGGFPHSSNCLSYDQKVEEEFTQRSIVSQNQS